MKNLYLGVRNYSTSLWIELSTIGSYLAAYWVGAIYLKLDAYATIWASGFSTTSAFVFYWISFKWGKQFSKYRNQLEYQKKQILIQNNSEKNNNYPKKNTV